MPQPVAVHIGYHKTATTWLQREVFPQHPRLQPYVSGRVWNDPFLRCIVADSDREFDPGKARTAYDAGLTRLGSLDADDVVVVSAERLSGHAASGGYDTFRIARRLHAVVPEARVLMVVRSQIDMIESEYRQLVGEGYRGRISSLWSSDAWKRVQFDLGHYEYDTLVREYQQLFGAENVGRLHLRGRRRRPQPLPRPARRTSSASSPSTSAPTSANRTCTPGLPNRGLGLLRTLNHFRRTELNPFPIVDLGVWWRGPIVAVSRMLPRRRHLIPAAKRAELAERYREPNDRLAKLDPRRGLSARFSTGSRSRCADPTALTAHRQEGPHLLGRERGLGPDAEPLLGHAREQHVLQHGAPDDAIAMPVSPSTWAPMISPPIVATNVIPAAMATSRWWPVMISAKLHEPAATRRTRRRRGSRGCGHRARSGARTRSA